MDSTSTHTSLGLHIQERIAVAERERLAREVRAAREPRPARRRLWRRASKPRPKVAVHRAV